MNKLDFFPFEYVGGGYFRQKGIPKGDVAETLHGMQAIDFMLKQMRFKPMKTIKDALKGEQFSYYEVLADLFTMISKPLNDKEIGLLVELCEFSGKFDFSKPEEFPHSRSPEEMLKSLASQTLLKSGKRELLQQLFDKAEESETKNMMGSLLRSQLGVTNE